MPPYLPGTDVPGYWIATVQGWQMSKFSRWQIRISRPWKSPTSRKGREKWGTHTHSSF